MARSNRLGGLVLGALVVTSAVGCAGDADEETVVAASSAATFPAKEARERLKNVIKDKDDNDARLARELARVGAFLTPDERTRYTRSFQSLSENRAVTREYHTRSRTLHDELVKLVANPAALASVMAGIQETARGGRGTFQRTVFGPRDLFEGFALLASTPHASAAVAFATRLLAQDPALAAIGVSDRDVVERILAPALPSAYAELLFESGNARAAQRALRQMLSDAGNACAPLADALDALRPGSNTSTIDGVSVAGASLGQPLRAIQGLISLWKVGDAISRGDAEVVMKSLLADGPNAVSGLAHATSVLRRTFLGIESTPAADMLVRSAARVGQGAAVILSVLAAIEHSADWDESESARVRVVGDLVAIGSCVLVFVGAGPAGAILGGVALGLSLFADLLHGWEVAERERREIVACLGQLGFSARLVDLVLRADHKMLDLLSRQVGLEPKHLRWLAVADETTVLGDPTLRLNGLIAAKKVFSLDGGGVYDLLRAVHGGEPDVQRGSDILEYFFRGLEYSGPPRFHDKMSRSEALLWLEGEATTPYVPDDIRDEWVTAFGNARAHLASR